MNEETRIEAVVTVDNNTNRVLASSTYGLSSPPEGPTAEKTTVVYLYTQPPMDLQENYYYDFAKEEFIKGPERPHPYVEWEASLNVWLPLEDEYLNAVSINRTKRLYLTDWCFVSDVSLPADDLEEVRLYREDLRNFPSTITDFSIPIEDQNWPEPPEFLLSDTNTRMLFTFGF
jgi:hypothetical protein